MLRASISSKDFSSRQLPCACGRLDSDGEPFRVAHVCTEANCSVHTRSPFICDHCYDSEDTPGHSKLKRIANYFRELSEQWSKLQENEKTLAKEVLQMYLPQQAIVELLEREIKLQTAVAFNGRLISEEMAKFQEFHREFQERYAKIEECMREDQTTKIWEEEAKFNEYTDKLTNRFGHLKTLVTVETIFTNYKDFIEHARIPEDSSVRRALFSFKERLIEQNARESMTPIDDPQTQIPEIASIRAELSNTSVPLRGLLSYLGGLHGAANFINNSLDAKSAQDSLQRTLAELTSHLHTLQGTLSDCTRQISILKEENENLKQQVSGARETAKIQEQLAAMESTMRQKDAQIRQQFMAAQDQLEQACNQRISEVNNRVSEVESRMMGGYI
ncbi:hypothetical protein FGO68_gene17339 [Halteria grandinella]|uniref:Uncharacterized protein n=1 Tax=Halteria grandinella TaxID=5974 RepID=A0A8J8T0R2_HALGN|nr:hypothetical protein FGO68_gene17339 [Halteria grandinella]